MGSTQFFAMNLELAQRAFLVETHQKPAMSPARIAASRRSTRSSFITSLPALRPEPSLCQKMKSLH
jgi:hypothetical protein